MHRVHFLSIMSLKYPIVGHCGIHLESEPDKIKKLDYPQAVH